MKHPALFKSLALLALVGAFPVAAQDATPEMTPDMDMTAEMAAMAALPESITFESTGLMPEGIDYDAANGRFLVGSLSQGTIYAVSADGTLTPFIEDEAFSSTVGIQVDLANQRLLVTNSDAAAFSDPTAPGLAELYAFDLNTGERIFSADLGRLTTLSLPEGRHFANDVAVGPTGSAYITDSFSPVIYRVDSEGSGYIWLQDEALTGGFLGLNGIDVSPEGGYLLFGVNGILYRAPLNAPETFAPVEFNEQFNIDGMIFAPDNSLYAVANLPDGTQEIVHITSEDGWQKAAVAERLVTDGNATTLTLVPNTNEAGESEYIPYYINAYLNDPTQTTYEIVRATFASAE